MKACKVICKTTGGLNSTTWGPEKGVISTDPYHDCENGVVFAVTDNPAKIYDEFL